MVEILQSHILCCENIRNSSIRFEILDFCFFVFNVSKENIMGQDGSILTEQIEREIK